MSMSNAPFKQVKDWCKRENVISPTTVRLLWRFAYWRFVYVVGNSDDDDDGLDLGSSAGLG